MKKLMTFICVSMFILAGALYAEGQQTQGGASAGPARPPASAFSNDAWATMDSAFEDKSQTLMDKYYLGRAVAANVLAAYKPYNGNSELTRYLNRICQTLVINSSQVEIYNGYHVLILDTPEFNAFATPGGHIFLTRGLINVATSEDMLAAVIAHELSHIMLDHAMILINSDEMQMSAQMSQAAGQGAALAGNTSAATRLMSYRNSVAGIVDSMLKNGYSKQFEFEADAGAVTLLAASGYDPASLVEVLRLLQQVQGSQRGGFNTTHPSPAERIANVQPVVSRYRVTDTRSYRTPRFKK